MALLLTVLRARVKAASILLVLLSFFPPTHTPMISLALNNPDSASSLPRRKTRDHSPSLSSPSRVLAHTFDASFAKRNQTKALSPRDHLVQSLHVASTGFEEPTYATLRPLTVVNIDPDSLYGDSGSKPTVKRIISSSASTWLLPSFGPSSHIVDADQGAEDFAAVHNN